MNDVINMRAFCTQTLYVLKWKLVCTLLTGVNGISLELITNFIKGAWHVRLLWFPEETLVRDLPLVLGSLEAAFLQAHVRCELLCVSLKMPYVMDHLA